MADEEIMCVVCKQQPPSSSIAVHFHTVDESSKLYTERLGTALGIKVGDANLIGHCLCMRCHQRLRKIEELQSMQNMFREEFLKPASHTTQADDVTSSTAGVSEKKPSFYQEDVANLKCAQLFAEKPRVQDPKYEEPQVAHNQRRPDDNKAKEKTHRKTSIHIEERTKDPKPNEGGTHCDICNTTFNTSRGLRLHQRVHTGTKFIICQLCGELFSTTGPYLRHIHAQHPDAKYYQCSLCEFTAHSKATIKRHASSSHKEEQAEAVDLCFVNTQPNATTLATKSSSSLRKTTHKLRSVGRRSVRGSRLADADKAETDTKPDSLGSAATLNPTTDIAIVINVDNEIDESQNRASQQPKYVEHVEGKQRVSSDKSNGSSDDDTKAASTAQDMDIASDDSGFETNRNVPRQKTRRNKPRSKSHSCSHCSRSFSHEVDLVDHMRDHTEGKVRQCTVCKLGFRQQSSLDIHLLKHTGHYPYHCLDCGKGFAKAWALKNHETTHTEDTPYKCKYCLVSFKNVAQRRAHYQRQHPQHLQEKKYECPHCGYLFSTMKYLDLHMRKQHVDETNEPWHCSICELSFPHLLEYKKHCQAEHEEEEKCFSCETCGKTFRRKANFHAHLETHSTERTAECQLCFKKYKGKAQLASHMHWHVTKARQNEAPTVGKPYLCEECGKYFKTIKALRSHIRCHRGEGTLTCQLCQLVVPTPSRLQKHMDTVHSAVRPYHCETCGKSFVYKVSYDAHLSMHKDLRPFLCSTCGRGFRTRPHLKEHMNVHLQVKTFACDRCELKFMWRAQLIRHKNNVHPDPNNPKPPAVKRGPRKKHNNNKTDKNTTGDQSQVSVVQHGQSEQVTPTPGLLSESDLTFTSSLLQKTVTRVSSIVPTQQTAEEAHILTNVVDAPNNSSGQKLNNSHMDVATSDVQGDKVHHLILQTILQESSGNTYILRPSDVGFVPETLTDKDWVSSGTPNVVEAPVSFLGDSTVTPTAVTHPVSAQTAPQQTTSDENTLSNAATPSVPLTMKIANDMIVSFPPKPIDLESNVIQVLPERETVLSAPTTSPITE